MSTEAVVTRASKAMVVPTRFMDEWTPGVSYVDDTNAAASDAFSSDAPGFGVPNSTLYLGLAVLALWWWMK